MAALKREQAIPSGLQSQQLSHNHTTRVTEHDVTETLQYST